jgi:hypothetical protein
MNAKDKHKILEWYCSEGYCGSSPNCDKHCPNERGNNPCFNYKILAEKLGIKKEIWITVKEK